MSNTTNLNLFKHDNPPTNKNQFDVEKSLNENWDKIDEFAGKQKIVNNKVTENEGQIETLKGQYEQLNQTVQANAIKVEALENTKADKTEVEGCFQILNQDQERQDKEIEALKIKNTTEKSKSLHITDSSNLEGKINIFGNSEQEVRSGKNILDINSNEVYRTASTTVEINGNTINATSNNNPVTSYVSIPIEVKANTDYAFSGVAKVVSNTITDAVSVYAKVRDGKNGGSWVSGGQATINKDSTTNQDLNLTFNTGSNTTVWVWLYIKSSGVTGIISIDFSNLQVEEGATKTDYEEYGASPSPEFPSDIKNVESNVTLCVFIGEGDITNYSTYEGEKIVFPLEEGQKLMLGDYLGEDEKIHHVRKQIELDGTENLQLRSKNDDGTYTYSLSTIIDYKHTQNMQAICSHFENLGTTNSVASMKTKGIGFSFYYNAGATTTSALYLNTTIETVEELIAWLTEQKEAGTPVILEYELAEEETEDFTENQKTAYKELQNAKTYKPITNITTEENMALIEAEYTADPKTYIDNKASEIKEQLNVINELLSTTKTSAKLLDNLKSDLESEVL